MTIVPNYNFNMTLLQSSSTKVPKALRRRAFIVYLSATLTLSRGTKTLSRLLVKVRDETLKVFTLLCVRAYVRACKLCVYVSTRDYGG